jgi:hypothetical protein
MIGIKKYGDQERYGIIDFLSIHFESIIVGVGTFHSWLANPEKLNS